ncbi:ADP-ribosylglycohydrolase family protein [Pleomorphovibrio marinus]|uniref:ADP-ribosylglycohydrolase family protein n=1 Tax=Pleomorphovibrio marinus TaxID=2164132 RepID=UPI000E0A2D11|nr:ADP-ribosylglycohydrolase family protein [Pleomorphovibrio marinus]
MYSNCKLLITYLALTLILFSCKTDKELEESITDKPLSRVDLTEAELYDKVLGMMVGSAIGDAMGTPTEMWTREEIWMEYGWVSKLDSMVREKSPEGIWEANLPAGGTTDDTRWKVLIMEYLSQQNGNTLNESKWVRKIYEQYQNDLSRFKQLNPEQPEDFEAQQLRVLWLQEWAKVSKPFLDNDLQKYAGALNKFYGGEMVCGGLLYGPAIGLFFPQDPEKAYKEAFKLSIFDIGYAKDLSALSAAMVSVAMQRDLDPQHMLEVIRSTDPEGYFDSRLVGRVAYRILRQALSISQQAKQEKNEDVPFGKEDPSVKKAFELLDEQQQDMPFHAGEIFLQVLTAMLFTDFDFEQSMQFLVNYGRDNDTTASLAGAILGTYYGFERLPDHLKYKCLDTNKEMLGIDMEALSKHFVKNWR